MAESKFNKVCYVLANYNFDINEDISNDGLCIICKKIMIDPYSGICGCQYCYRCIKDYIGEDQKHCPGGTEECTVEFLVIERNVNKSHATRRKISNMMVKCPNTSCFFKSKLEDIYEHIRICTMTPMECPFVMFGCINEGLREDNVKVHLDLDELKHSQMIVDAINHLKNDVNGLKQMLEEKETETNEMKEETENNKRLIEDLKEYSRRKETLMRVEIDELKAEIRILKDNQERIESQNEIMNQEEMVMMKNEINELKIINEEKNKNDIEDGRKKEKEMMNEINEIKEEIKILKNNEERRECESEETRKGEMMLKKEFEMIKTVVVKIKENMKKIFEVEIVNMKNNIKRNAEEMKVIMMTKEVFLNIKEDIVWTIKDFTNKINNEQMIEYFSESFYKDDYKLCLRADIGLCKMFGVSLSGNRCLQMSVIIMRGDKDDRVQWPMKDTIKINIINQNSLKIHHCWTVNYDEYDDKSLFDKPKLNDNKYIDCGIIPYSNFKDIQGIIKNDSIIVGCSLSSK